MQLSTPMRKTLLTLLTLCCGSAARMAFAQAVPDTDTCKALCTSSQSECVGKIGAFYTLHNAPDPKLHDMGNWLQEREARQGADIASASELKQQCSDEARRCQWACRH